MDTPAWIDDIEARSNLTRSQFLIWMGQRLASQAPLYNMAFAFRLEGELEPKAFRAAFQRLVDDADILRTVIEEHDGVPMQRVLDAQEARLETIDLTADENPEHAYQHWLRRRAGRALQLDRCLYDAALVRLDEAVWVWYFNQHHVVTDAASAALLCEQMAERYAAAGAPAPIPAFQPYAAAEREGRKSERSRRAGRYWAAKVDGPPARTRFYGASRAAGSLRTERQPLDLGASRTAALQRLAAKKDVQLLNEDLSLFTVFATVLLAYLHRIDGTQERLILGAPVHNRATAALKATPGLFIEALPFAVDVEDDESFASLLVKVRQEVMKGLSHGEAGVSTAQSNHAYDVLLNFITARMPAFPGLTRTTQWVHSGFGDVTHKLRLQVHDFDDSGSLQLDFDLDRDVFSAETASLAVDHFVRMLEAFLADRTQLIERVPLSSPADEHERVVGFNSTNQAYPRDESLASLFFAQAGRTPDAVAIRSGTETLTYADLASRASRLGAHLRGHGVGEGKLTAIAMNRSADAVVAMLAVLQAGGAYLPLDPRHPRRRRAAIIEDVSASELGPMPVILTTTALAGDLPDHPGVTVPVDTLELPADEVETTPVTGGQRLAYVIYTSGSTGAPKGALIPHSAAVNYVSWAAQRYCGDERLDFALHTSLAVDLTVTSIFVPLITGGAVVVYDDEGEADVPILRVFEDDAVDVVKLTPAHLALIGEIGGRAERLRTLILGGEDLKTELVRTVLHQFPADVAIYNEYGPTEATVGCMLHRFDADGDNGSSVGIGRPIANACVYLLDKRLEPVPSGLVGEICIGGNGVAAGYLNRPELTAERFVADPFRPGGRLYRTGDLGRWSTSGELEFLGRADHQVKLRGTRVELGDVEAVLGAHPDVHNCVASIVSGAGSRPDRKCTKCGIPAGCPGVELNEDDLCSMCIAFDLFEDKARAYFRTMSEFDELVEEIRAQSSGEYDCLVLLSGGKDSTYMLYQVVAHGLKPLIFTLDNGFIAEGAMDNIRRSAKDLGVDYEFASTPHMNEIFVDSLERFSNVCNGCFKTIYTLCMKIARERGINYIVTGLSRGQIFETRLEDLFRQRIFDADAIEQAIIEARKFYHRVDDAVARALDIEIFSDDSVFTDIRFVDFYRYCDVDLDEVYRFLGQQAPWVRPADTGRSTNCLINDAGIYVHKRERGFHNYALPYSWDVRLGHKQREAALDELDDEIDTGKVHSILDEIGYVLKPSRSEARLAAYYVAEQPLPATQLREYLVERLPAEMVPAHFVHMEKLPLDSGGKVDRRALQEPDEIYIRRDVEFVEPIGEVEHRLAQVWTEVLALSPIGRHDNFIELGGDSILTIQVVARANEAGLRLTPAQMFEQPTIAELAKVVGTSAETAAEQGLVTGDVPFTPIQGWFFAQKNAAPQHWNQSLLLAANSRLQAQHVASALEQLLEHHDALRLSFTRRGGIWRQHCDGADAIGASVERVELNADDANTRIEETIQRLEGSLELEGGPLIRAAIFAGLGARPDKLFITAHHLAVDAVSWSVLLRDLETACSAAAAGRETVLPPKTNSFKRWGEVLSACADSDDAKRELDYWASQLDPIAARLPADFGDAQPATQSAARQVAVTLDSPETEQLLYEVHAAYNTRIDELLLTSLARTLARACDSGAVVVDLEGHGRDEDLAGGNLSRTVGCFTALYPVRLAVPDGAGDGETIKAVKEQLRAVPGSGIGFGLLKHGNADASGVLSALPSARIRFNYLGHVDRLLAGSKLFRRLESFDVSSAPGNALTHDLDVAAYVSGGSLRLDWTYNGSACPESVVTALTAAYLADLRALIGHCLSPQSGDFTPSDFPEAQLDQGDLDDILAEFRE